MKGNLPLHNTVVWVCVHFINKVDKSLQILLVKITKQRRVQIVNTQQAYYNCAITVYKLACKTALKNATHVTRIYFQEVSWRMTQPGLKGQSQKGWGGVGFLEDGQQAPSPPARYLGECCKLPQWGPGQSPGWNRYPLSSPVVSIINLVTNNRSVLCVKFFAEISGSLHTPKTPPSYGLAYDYQLVLSYH